MSRSSAKFAPESDADQRQTHDDAPDENVLKFGRFNSNLYLVGVLASALAFAATVGVALWGAGVVSRETFGAEPWTAQGWMMVVGVVIMVAIGAFEFFANYSDSGGLAGWVMPRLMRGGRVGVESAPRRLENELGEVRWQPEYTRPSDGTKMRLLDLGQWVPEDRADGDWERPLALSSKKSAERRGLYQYRVQLAHLWMDQLEAKRVEDLRRERERSRFRPASEVPRNTIAL